MSGIDALQEILLEAATIAEHMFDPEDQMMAHILAVGADGKRSLYACPMANATEERMFRIGVPMRLRREGALRWCFFCEAWCAAYEVHENMRDKPPADRADRIEVITFFAEELSSGRALQASRQIFRGTAPAKLLPLVVNTGPSGYVIVEQGVAR